jgi:enoyl-[acyl-carrier protein] reductase II
MVNSRREKRMDMLRTRLCELLGIQYPIVQAPMTWITGADLAAAVSNAGGLGTIGPNAGAKSVTTDVVETGERLRSQIKKAKNLTNKPFAVNVTIGSRGKPEFMEFSKQCVKVILEEEVPVVISSVGGPQVYTKVLKEAGTKVLHAVSNVRYARRAEAEGVDGLVVQGVEGGGFKGLEELTTMVLVPMVADAVNIPIVAAGGIADGRGMIAALALGAEGIYMGTRFFATKECDADPKAKEMIAQAGDMDTANVRIPNMGMMVRALRNEYTEKALEILAGPNPEEYTKYENEHSILKGVVLGDRLGSLFPCGACAGMIASVPSAREVIESIVKDVKIVSQKFK